MARQSLKNIEAREYYCCAIYLKWLSYVIVSVITSFVFSIYKWYYRWNNRLMQIFANDTSIY